MKSSNLPKAVALMDKMEVCHRALEALHKNQPVGAEVYVVVRGGTTNVVAEIKFPSRDDAVSWLIERKNDYIAELREIGVEL